MEVDSRPDENSDPNQGQSSEKLDKYKQTLFAKLNEQSETNLDKCFSQALFIQAMFKQDLNVMIKLLNFYLDKNQIQMTIDLLFNDLFKNFDLNQTNEFDIYLNKISLVLIKHLCPSISFITEKSINNLDDKDEFFYDLFQKMNTNLQDLLIAKILDKYRYIFNKYLKLFIESDKKSTPVQPSQQQDELKEFYLNFSQTYKTLYLIKDLLLVFKKHALEYGLYLIDTFLNIEKHMHTFLVQNNNQLKLDPSLTSIEKRSLNLIRRICVLDLIRQFSVLIDKLDNRHCYRWIEKCLEFFTKYSNCSTQVTIESNMENEMESVNVFYSSIKLLHDQEILVNDEIESDEEKKQEIIKTIKESLTDLIEYKYEPNPIDLTPYSNVYRLLDDIGKKLDWPTIPDKFQTIEDKLTYLFSIKSKPDKNISISSLNKQISFYGLTFFFNKLTEFQALNRALFNDQLILSPMFRQETDLEEIEPGQVSQSQIQTVSNLVYSIKIWQKFNLHKEYYTIVTKCLSNSKLDSLNSYKSFLADYYSSFQLCSQSSQTYNWSNLTGLSLKQKIPIISSLFMSEKTSFKNFFDELLHIFNDPLVNSNTNDFYIQLSLNKNLIDLFECDKKNLVKYFSKLLTNKLSQMIEQKKTASSLFENDSFISALLILIQSSKCDFLHNFVIQSIRSKNSMDYEEFFDQIYDVKILQDIFNIVKQIQDVNTKFKLGQQNENLNEKFLNQLNFDHETYHDITFEFILKNSNIILDIFDKVLNM